MTLEHRFIQLGLSVRQREVANEILLGHSNIVIADRLFVCEKTVKFHAGEIFKKCFVKTRGQLIAKYLPQKLSEDAAAEIFALKRRVLELENLLVAREKEAQRILDARKKERGMLPAGRKF